jgi:hypothetical protein
MAYGIIEYDEKGNPICEICGKGFSKVISHVWQAHEMTGKEYKKEYGGLFIVDNEEVVPNFADIVFLNFSGDSDPYHEVSKVVEDVNRFALLFNVQYNR